jgi:hypothetical protein
MKNPTEKEINQDSKNGRQVLEIREKIIHLINDEYDKYSWDGLDRPNTMLSLLVSSTALVIAYGTKKEYHKDVLLSVLKNLSKNVKGIAKENDLNDGME